MTKLYTYRFRIYPDKKQIAFLNMEIGNIRFVYNFFLERANRLYKTGVKFNYYEFKKILPPLKKGFPFLKVSNSQSLQASLKNLDTAFKNYFQKRAGKPVFKKRYDYNSISIPQSFTYLGNRLYIPKMDTPLKLKVNRYKKNLRVVITEEITSVSISKTKAGKYYANISVNKNIEPLPEAKSVSGIDLGLKDYAAITTGAEKAGKKAFKIDNPKYLIKSSERLKKLNREFSKKKKGSKNKAKFREKRLSVLQEKVSNQRMDFLHKLSSGVIYDSQVIALEDLNIKGMVKNKHLSKSIHDASWSKFIDMLTYKADWHGRDVFKVNRFYPSSKTCSNCGHVYKDLKLRDRQWTCPICGVLHDRDLNASDNLFLEGLTQLERDKAGKAAIPN